MSLIIPANTLASGGYAVDNSCRFNDGSSDNLTRTPSSQSNLQKSTFSFWFKRSTLGEQVILSTGSPDTSGSLFMIYFSGNDSLHIETDSPSLVTNRKFRDVSAWYHIVVAVDTTQGTDTNRVKIYVNGVQETSFSLEQYPSQNANLNFNKTNVHYIGVLDPTYGTYFDGYMAEVVEIDGTQNAVTDFGEFDEDSGIWKPIDVSGLTFGTNGFYLDFEDSGALGADVSGNSNNFTVNNLTAIDQTTDTPTNNFATINPLFNDVLNIATMSDGNLTILSTSGYWSCSPASLAFSSGKWYYEVKWLTGTGGDYVGKVGWGNPDKGKFMETQGSILYRNSNGQKFIDNSGSAYGATWTTANDIIGVAIDVDGGTVTFYKNGSSQGDITISGGLDDGTFIIPYIQVANTDKVSVNFGNPPFTISSGNADGNGYGNFEYAPPSGYLSLCTKNLSEVLG